MNRLKSLCCNTLYLTFDKNDSDLQYDVLQYTIALVKNTDIITLFQLENFNVCKQSMIRLTTPFAKEKFWENKWKHHLSYYTIEIYVRRVKDRRRNKFPEDTFWMGKMIMWFSDRRLSSGEKQLKKAVKRIIDAHRTAICCGVPAREQRLFRHNLRKTIKKPRR